MSTLPSKAGVKKANLVKRIENLEQLAMNTARLLNVHQKAFGIYGTSTAIVSVIQRLLVEKEIITRDEFEKAIKDCADAIQKKDAEGSKQGTGDLRPEGTGAGQGDLGTRPAESGSVQDPIPFGNPAGPARVAKPGDSTDGP